MAHPLAGRKQSAEHVAKRIAAATSARMAWPDERRAEYSRLVSERNRMRSLDVKKRLSAAMLGRVPWNKGNNWRDRATPDEVKARARDRAKRHRLSLAVRLSERMSAGIRHSLATGKNGRSWEALAGYTVSDLKRHLEGLFQPGMGWHNFGAWHIDHMKPKSSFEFSSADDSGFRECWALSNLQPLWAKDNLIKGARLSQAA